ncbi:MAG TPA: phosphate ABC transporter permease PstA [Caldilineaceae bacterium]|nr:phosphate ABC transporter permease PstA [Caldilineaceae bacterium]
MAMAEKQSKVFYPEGGELADYVEKRKRRGLTWQIVFMAATLIGIISLVALLYNIINSAFGYVALQNEVDPAALVLDVERERLLNSSNLTSSEDDEELAAGVIDNPYAIGFFGYAYYQEHADKLNILTIDGVEPTADNVESGEYPLARPLYFYTDADRLVDKPAVAAFVQYYLDNVNSVIDEVGYFPASANALETDRTILSRAVGDTPTDDAPAADLLIAGSSTVYPLTQQLATRFAEAGFTGNIDVQSIGSGAGLELFCSRNSEVDIANASRDISRGELEACRDAKREPLEFQVGTDALAIVVNQQNTFAQSVTMDELRTIFTGAELWSDVNAEWPAEPIVRYIPGVDSGTLDFFAETVFSRELSDLPKETLTEILQANVSSGLMRRFENDQPFAERSQESVYELVKERVVAPTVVGTWSLVDSIFKRAGIDAFVEDVPNGSLEFRSWLTWRFVTSPQSSTPEDAGIRTAILGSLWVILITLLFSLPLGVGAAIYLEEYAEKNWFNRMIDTNINNLAGVPSIIYGMLGLAIFVRIMAPLTSGTLFGVSDPTTANGRTVLSAGLTLGLLILPLIIINAREAIRAVPNSLRQASYGLGATKWQTIWNHVLPMALPGILTGNILAMSRAIGETAPLVVIGASTFIVVDPSNPFSKFTTLPIQIYQWTARPQDEFRNIAAAAIIALLILLLSLNAGAVLLRNRFSTRM